MNGEYLLTLMLLFDINLDRYHMNGNYWNHRNDWNYNHRDAIAPTTLEIGIG